MAEYNIQPLVHDSIHIVTSLDGRPSGVAFVEFASVELYKLNALDTKLESAWFQPFNLTYEVHEKPVSKFAFKFNLYRYTSAEDSAAAMTKDRHSMGSRYVELFPSSREEATRAATAGR
jgi:heterogeneous nuclear ribonucleoprotein F/H